MHTGSVVAGVIGRHKFIYDLCWTFALQAPVTAQAAWIWRISGRVGVAA